MLGVLAGSPPTTGERLAPALSALLTDSVLTRAKGACLDTELSALYVALARRGGMAAVPAAHAVLLFRAAEIGAQLVLPGAGRAGLADEVAAAFRAARAGLRAVHPLAPEVAARAAAFEAGGRNRQPPGPVTGRRASPRTRR